MMRVQAGFCAIGVALCAMTGGAALADDTSLQAPVQSRLARAATSKVGLAALHQSKANAECRTCHGATIAPDDNESVENKACVGCHGDYAKLAPETVKKLKNKNINPHKSHLGPEIACTVCHSGHAESVAYCTQCHTNFVMPMPAAAKN